MYFQRLKGSVVEEDSSANPKMSISRYLSLCKLKCEATRSEAILLCVAVGEVVLVTRLVLRRNGLVGVLKRSEHRRG